MKKLILAILLLTSTYSFAGSSTDVGPTFNSGTIGAPYPESRLRPFRAVQCKAKDLIFELASRSDLLGGTYNIQRKSLDSYISASDVQTGAGNSDEVSFQKISARKNISNVKQITGQCLVQIDTSYEQDIKFNRVTSETRLGFNVGDELTLSCAETLYVPHYFCK